jgi:hypothetical protein
MFQKFVFRMPGLITGSSFLKRRCNLGLTGVLQDDNAQRTVWSIAMIIRWVLELDDEGEKAEEATQIVMRV